MDRLHYTLEREEGKKGGKNAQLLMLFLTAELSRGHNGGH